MAKTDVAFEILAQHPVECLLCGFSDLMVKFGRWVTDRAGLTIVDCRCPSCRRRFRRIYC